MNELSSRPENQAKKGKINGPGFWFNSLNNVRKQTVLLWEVQNRFRMSTKEPKCHKLHKDLTKPQ